MLGQSTQRQPQSLRHPVPRVTVFIGFGLQCKDAGILGQRKRHGKHLFLHQLQDLLAHTIIRIINNHAEIVMHTGNDCQSRREHQDGSRQCFQGGGVFYLIQDYRRQIQFDKALRHG